MKKELIAHQEPKSPISEIFRTLRTNIQFMNTKNKLKTILVTSTLPGEGKSWVTSNLAVTFAQAGKKVVLIDADMRKGRQYTIFGVSPIPGLSNYLSGIGVKNEEASDDLADYIQETDVDNLYIMTAGNIPPNPSELLISPQMVNLLDELKELCDIIIIDGTPNELVTDSLILTRLVDSTIIVTASKQTKKDNLKRVIANIQNVGGKIAGVVLNKVPISTKKYEQSYYYGSTSMMDARNHTTNRKRPQSKQIKVEEMKRRVRPENVQNVREKQMPRQVHNRAENNNISKEHNMQRKLKVENSEGVSLEKTNDILKQINDYLDKEKKDLN